MKYIISKLGLFVLASVILLSCADKLTEAPNAIYLSGARGEIVKQVLIETDDVSIDMKSRSAVKTDKEQKTSILINKSFLDEYNKEYATKFELLPSEYYVLENKQSIIKEGEVFANSVNLTIKKELLQVEGETIYAIPVTVQLEGGDLPILETAKSLLYVIKKPINSFAANLSKGQFDIKSFVQEKDEKNVYIVPLRDDKLSALPEATFETFVNVDKFRHGGDPGITSVMGTEGHFLLRFGDSTIEPDQFQVAGMGTNITASMKFAPKTWYHIAVVLTNSTKVSIYVDGEFQVSGEIPDQKGFNFAWSGQGPFAIGKSYQNGRVLLGSVAECRVWRIARTQREIKNNMYYVDPKTEGLEAYWRFNEGKGNDIKDHTKNGYDLQLYGGDVSWFPVQFPFKK